MIVREHGGLEIQAAPTNDRTLRRESVAGTLNHMVDERAEPATLAALIC